ncbi:MAG: TATA-box-binding protein [Candidatus Bathyarchaeia archaeon]
MFKIKRHEAVVKIVNVVASAALKQRVDLDAVVKGFPSADFPSEQFPGIVFRLKKPKTATLIFGSGKIICTGGKSEKEARRAVAKVVRELSKSGIIVPNRPEVKIDNIVASASLGRTVDLESISALQGTTYEPDQFPALIYRMDDPEVVFLIFSTGRLVCVGARNEQEIHRAIRELHQKLEATNFCVSPFKLHENEEMKRAEYIPVRRVELKDFAFSGSKGKACVYVRGLWCRNKFCVSLSCRFADMIQRRLADGFYGCWGFHWQQGWYATEIKKSQRKFIDFSV